MEALRQPEYVHVLLNHLPVTGLFAALLCLLGALIIRQRAALLLGMALVTLFSLSAWPVSNYGEEGYDRVYSMADNQGDAWLDQHKQLAERWVWVFYVTAALAAASLVVALKWPKSLYASASVVAVLALASLIAGAVIADAGGKVRHSEFRSGSPPAPPAHSALPRSRQAAPLARQTAQPRRERQWPAARTKTAPWAGPWLALASNPDHATSHAIDHT